MQLLRASIEGAVGPGRPARRGRRLRLFPVLAGLFSSYRPEEELGAGPESPPSSDPLARLATVGGLHSRQRKSRARRRPRPFPDTAPPNPSPSVRMLLGASGGLERAPASLHSWPRPCPRPPRSLTHASHANAANVRLPRVLRAEALAYFLTRLRGQRTRPGVSAVAGRVRRES